MTKHLGGAAELGTALGGGSRGEVDFRARAGAAYGVHRGAESYSGVYTTLGLGPALWKSVKQKCATRSSCEAELAALPELASLAAWVRGTLREAGEAGVTTPMKVMEDSKAATDLATSGAFTSDRPKHAHTRSCSVAQLAAPGELEASHCPAEYVTAGVLTKPLALALAWLVARRLEV